MTSRWQPKFFKRFAECRNSSTGVARILTDAGEAFIKAIGNPEGPHALAKEWIGTSLAKWFGLPTLEFAIMNVKDDDLIPIGHERNAQPGPAFLTKAHKGMTWGGDEKALKRLDNPEVITRLVIFDMWLLNVDRCPPAGMSRGPHYDNVFFSGEGASKNRVRLIAMDFTHCFLGGGELAERVADIDKVRDKRIYGLFPAFKKYILLSETEKAVHRLREVAMSVVEEIVREVPSQWNVPDGVRSAICNFIYARAQHLADNMPEQLLPSRYQQGNLSGF